MVSWFIKIFRKYGIGLALTAGSIAVVCILAWIGIFDTVELKTYDYRFHTVRGPLTGWRANDSTYIKMGTDVVLLEVDAEAWRLMPEEWPYPHGTVWGRVVRNLYQAGARVIVFDIQFDTKESKSEYLHSWVQGMNKDFIQSQLPGIKDSTFATELSNSLPYLIPRHGDVMFGEAIAEAQAYGTEVVINIKKEVEPSRHPPEYLAMPVEEIMRGDPETGLINDFLDIDNFSRRYGIAGYLNGNTDVAYLTLAVKAVKSFLGLGDSLIAEFDWRNGVCNYGPIPIQLYARGQTFLVNYYGPASGYKVRDIGDYPPWGTFPKFSLAYVIDTDDIELRDPAEDIDWMSQFLPGEIPEWIEEIEDPAEKQEMIELMGIGGDFDVTQTPFYNKIVVIGASIEVLLDVKSTPFYNYMGIQQMTPGLETHANAIQTLIHKNFINVLGGYFTEYYIWGIPWEHIALISFLSVIAFLLLSMGNPVIAGVLIIFEGLIYFAIVCGLFVDDLWWAFRKLASFFVTDNYIFSHFDFFHSDLPLPDKSWIIPLIVPLAGIIVTYTSNIIYQFINEQKDKTFLKSTFGAYISPELIDQMYEEKQEPKLGGDEGYHTAFFTDIQNFSSFSELLEPEKMVGLMNEYLTEMTNVLLDFGGTLDKYIGDAIVAFYGAPVPVENHELLACQTALKMEERLGELREKWRNEEEWPEIVHNMRHRIGISTGNLVTGNMGSESRMNYTMMGDTVNITARLEASAKQYGVYIQVGENTYKSVKDKFEWRFLDSVRVKGKKVPIKTYELLCEKGKLDPEQKKCIDLFHEGQELYFKQKWDEAVGKFEASNKLEDMFKTRPTNPSDVYIGRCRHLKDNPPGDDWDGVWILTTK